MKTKFLPKLFLLSLFCVAFNSCSEDEIMNYTQGASSTTSATTTTMNATTTTNPIEQPVLTKPR